jgi:LmbE family N-acetylglucosaminyl deacetylase
MSPATERTAAGRQEAARRWLHRLEARKDGLGEGLLIVVAHADDEVIGVGGQLAWLSGVRLVHVTDGAPRNLQDARAAGFGSWQDYAAARRQELLAALRLAGIEAAQADQLDIPDQQASFRLVELANTLAAKFTALRPEVIITHAYEGGHPDHDATAFAVHAACALVERRGGPAPALIEITGYHLAPEGRVLAEFLPRPGSVVTTLVLGERERAFKQRLVDGFLTQRRVLADFPIEVERLRPAPAYDFTRPPHGGPLYYEQFDWGVDGIRWRALAGQALAELEITDQPWA